MARQEKTTKSRPEIKDFKKGSRKESAKQKYPCRICKKLGHWAAECSQEKKEEPSSFLALGASTKVLDPEDWYYDSGASRHICPKREDFDTCSKFQTPRRVSFGKRDVCMFAIGEGDVRLQTTVQGRYQQNFASRRTSRSRSQCTFGISMVDSEKRVQNYVR